MKEVLIRDLEKDRIIGKYVLFDVVPRREVLIGMLKCVVHEIEEEMGRMEKETGHIIDRHRLAPAAGSSN